MSAGSQHIEQHPSIVGRSTAIQRLRSWIEQVAPHQAPVLLLGETGTGKDVVARSLAYHPSRPSGPYVPINCGALGESLIESELFGHERGAFTGATGRKMGAFEAADGGTLFLDEIGELPLGLQAQLLRVLESGEVRRVGSTQAVHVKVRIIAATNRGLAEQVRSGAFRADLFHRLHVLVAELPALRHRPDDIPALTQHFLRLDAPLGRSPHGPPQLTETAVAKLLAHTWPGNVRELRNVLQRAVLLSPGCTVEGSAVTFAPLLTPSFDLSAEASRTLQDIEREAILAELRRQRGNRKAAAEALGLSRSTLHRRLHDLGIFGEL